MFFINFMYSFFLTSASGLPASTSNHDKHPANKTPATIKSGTLKLCVTSAIVPNIIERKNAPMLPEKLQASMQQKNKAPIANKKPLLPMPISSGFLKQYATEIFVRD